MAHLTLHTEYIKDIFIEPHELAHVQSQVSHAHQLLNEKTGPGSDFLGWIDWPETYDKDEFSRIKKAAEKIRTQSEVFVVIGIGGSYLGADAALTFLNHTFYNQLSAEKRNGPEIYFAGHNMSAAYYYDLFDIIGDKDFSINVISKSGTTTEPSLAFRLFKERLIEKYGEKANEHIFATTDATSGALRTESDDKGYETFVIPDNIGGRFTVLTAVGLLPIAVSGHDIDSLLQGARDAMATYASDDLSENDAYLYAAIRNILYHKGYTTEILATYEPGLRQFAEWWKQLFGESEGKDQRGIYPSSVHFSTDLHSLGQYIQDGRRDLFETVLHVEESKEEINVPEIEGNLDGLGYLEGAPLTWVNDKAFEATVLAHVDGGVPNLVLSLPKLDIYTLGYLFYFFEKAVAISGYLNAVNPFDQPGVEAYKQNMFALLGKPGYENEKENLEQRLKILTE